MREILFRGKRVDNGEWIEGSFLPGNERQTLHPCIFVYLPETQSFECFDIDIDTLGEYTGLMDRNATRIFEGDVIKDDKHLYLIEWYASDFDAGFWPFICSANCRAVRSCNCEIIGNIHDNPELLKGA